MSTHIATACRQACRPNMGQSHFRRRVKKAGVSMRPRRVQGGTPIARPLQFAARSEPTPRTAHGEPMSLLTHARPDLGARECRAGGGPNLLPSSIEDTHTFAIPLNTPRATPWWSRMTLMQSDDGGGRLRRSLGDRAVLACVDARATAASLLFRRQKLVLRRRPLPFSVEQKQRIHWQAGWPASS